MPSHYTQDQIQLLKNTICKGISDNDFMIFGHICKRTGLDPFARQIYAVARGGKMTIQTGIDGYRLIAERTGKYAPGKEPTYAYDANSKLLSATAFVKKQTADGTWHEVSATAFYSEYVQIFNGVPSQFWAKMPHGQLAKCAEALALRRAFPQEMSGIYTKDEMQQADLEVDPELEAQAEIIEDQKKNECHAAPLIKLITEKQANDLREELKKCSKDYKIKLEEHMKKIGLNGFHQFSETFYKTVMKSIIRDQESNVEQTEEVAS